MEDSLGSSGKKAVVSKTISRTTDVPEESGWTAYFEDFLSKQREKDDSSSSDRFCSPSLVSDAASCAARKINNNNPVAACSPMGGSATMPKKLSFKKARTKEISCDDSLEDTASSPVNSPKVSSLKQKDTIPRKRDDNIESSLGKGGTDFSSEILVEERKEINFNGNVNNEYSGLKKRGLCLVPLSMLVNYLG